MKRISIIGSREYPERNHVSEYISNLPNDSVIVTGGRWETFRSITSGPVDMIRPTPGVDSWAAEAGRYCGMHVVVVPADWDTYGRGAGMRRNPVIVDLGDQVVAFWDGKSTGTKGALSYARKVGKPWKIRTPEGWNAEQRSLFDD